MSEDDPKAENLMMKTWHGPESARCDGNIYGYSNLSYILFNKPKKQTKLNFFEMITSNFHINLKVDYAFQYRYRSKSISFFFRKEFAIALVMLCFF